MSLRDKDIETSKKRLYNTSKYCDPSTIITQYERKCLISKLKLYITRKFHLLLKKVPHFVRYPNPTTLSKKALLI